MRRNNPHDRFTRRVITQLLSRPKQLEVAGDPLQTVWQELRVALRDYDVVDGDEVESVKDVKF